MHIRPRTIALSAAAVVAALGILACSGGTGTKGTVSKNDPSGKPAASAPAANKPAEPKIATGKVGDTITLTHGDNSAQVTVGAPTQWKGDTFIKPEKGAAFTVIKINIVVVSGNYSANPFNFHLVAADGSRYDNALIAPDPQLHAADLVAGQKSTGNVSWDVPASVLAGAQIEVDGDGMDVFSTVGIWKL